MLIQKRFYENKAYILKQKFSEKSILFYIIWKVFDIYLTRK